MADLYNCPTCKKSKTIVFEAKAKLSNNKPYDIKMIFVKTKDKQKIDIRRVIKEIEIKIGKKITSYSGTLTFTKCGCVVDCSRALEPHE